MWSKMIAVIAAAATIGGAAILSGTIDASAQRRGGGHLGFRGGGIHMALVGYVTRVGAVG